MYKPSDEYSQAIESRILVLRIIKEFQDLPYADQLDFLGKIFESSSLLFLSAGISAISHGIFNQEMEVSKLPISDETNKRIKKLIYYQTELESINKSLRVSHVRELKKKYEKSK